MSVPLTLSQVPAQTPYVQYVATGGQTVFPYPFVITQDSDLVVIYNGATLATDSGYSLSGQGNPTGGNVTFTAGATAGDIVTMYRDVTIERITQIGQNSGFSSTAFNAEYNNIYLILQQLQEATSFCLQIPSTNIGSPNPVLTPAAYANKGLSFDANGNPQPFALVSSALTQSTFNSFLNNCEFTGVVNQAAPAFISKTTTFSGGAATVTPALMVNTVVGANDANFEWVILGQLDNYSNSAQAQNVAVNGTGRMRGTSATWGGNFVGIDYSNTGSAGKKALTGCEVDMYCNGTDAGGLRVALNIVCGDGNYNGPNPGVDGLAGYATYGILVSSQYAVSAIGAAVQFANGMIVNDTLSTGTSFQTSADNIYAYRTLGTVVTAYDTSQATVTGATLRMATSQYIAFDASNLTRLYHPTSGGAGRLRYDVSGVETVSLLDSGGMLVLGVQVIGVQQTTAVAAAGFNQVDTTTAVSTDSTFDGYTLRQVVKALRLHGLLA